MKRTSILTLFAAAALVSACGGNKAGGDGENTPVTAGEDGELVKQVVKTEQDGYLMGDPDAPVRLTEYGSLVCVHCRDFEQEAMGEIKELVDQGKISYEFRNFLLGGLDIAPTVLTRCAGPERYFALTDAWYSDWDAQMKKAQEALSDSAFKQKLQTMEPAAASVFIAEKTGVIGFFAARGVSRDQAKSCLSDEAMMKEVENLRKEGIEDGVKGTPTFLIDGQQVEFSGWPALKSQLVEAGAD